jgi:hypothetical protein
MITGLRGVEHVSGRGMRLAMKNEGRGANSPHRFSQSEHSEATTQRTQQQQRFTNKLYTRPHGGSHTEEHGGEGPKNSCEKDKGVVTRAFFTAKCRASRRAGFQNKLKWAKSAKLSTWGRENRTDYRVWSPEVRAQYLPNVPGTQAVTLPRVLVLDDACT